MNANRFRLLLIILVVICCFSCQKRNRQTITTNVENTQIDSSSIVETNWLNDTLRLYLQYFKTVDLPIVINGCSINIDNLEKFNFDKYYDFNHYHSYAYAQIPTNGNYVAVITLGITLCYLPILTTYTFEGEIIDEQLIGIGYNSDCMSFMTIGSDYTILTADTVIEYNDCFLRDTIIEKYIIYRIGQLLPNGKIKLSEKQKKVLFRKED